MQTFQRNPTMIVGQILGLGVVSLPGNMGGGKGKDCAHNKIVAYGSIQKAEVLLLVIYPRLINKPINILGDLAGPQGTVDEIDMLQFSIDA